MLRIFANYYIFFIYYLYLSWFDSKSLFAIARYSLRYSFLALEKKMPLFAIARYLKLWTVVTCTESYETGGGSAQIRGSMWPWADSCRVGCSCRNELQGAAVLYSYWKTVPREDGSLQLPPCDTCSQEIWGIRSWHSGPSSGLALVIRLD
jgi:hypothetical protein